MFQSTFNTGFQITFPNGYTVSCQFGSTNYCSRRNQLLSEGIISLSREDEMKTHINESPDCEVAVWHMEGRYHVTAKVMEAIGITPSEYGSASVQAYVTPSQFAKIVAHVEAMS